MTAQQLKNSILQMAVQGKLVPQDPNDEPASALIQKIREEKGQMIRDGEIKTEKNPSFIFRGGDGLFYEKVGNKRPVCIEDEVPFEIPDSWEWVRVKQFTISRNGKAFKPSDWSESGLPIVRIQNLNDHSAPYNYYNGPIEPEFLLHGNELLFAWSGTPGTSFGAHIWYGKEAVLNQHIFKLEFDKSLVYKPYYMYALNQRVSLLISEAHGSAGLQHVTKSVFENTLIPLPPYNEQKKIVSKLEYLTPRINEYGVYYDNLETLNNSFPDQLKKSILQMAVQGKLVPQDPDDEPASVLIKKIHDEKEQLIKDGKIKRDKHESVISRQNGSYYEKIDGKEQCIDDEIPFEIPDSWEWIRLGTVCEIARGGSPRPIKQYITESPNGINWIKISDADKGGKYISSAKEKITPEGVCRSRKVHAGDFLLTNSMSFGRPYILKIDGCIHDGWLVLSHYQECFNIDFLYYMLSSPYAYYQFCGVVSGAVVKNLNSDKVAHSLFPVPPIDEQMRIVDKVNQALQVIDSVKG